MVFLFAYKRGHTTETDRRPKLSLLTKIIPFSLKTATVPQKFLASFCNRKETTSVLFMFLLRHRVLNVKLNCGKTLCCAWFSRLAAVFVYLDICLFWLRAYAMGRTAAWKILIPLVACFSPTDDKSKEFQS